MPEPVGESGVGAGGNPLVGPVTQVFRGGATVPPELQNPVTGPSDPIGAGLVQGGAASLGAVGDLGGEPLTGVGEVGGQSLGGVAAGGRPLGGLGGPGGGPIGAG